MIPSETPPERPLKRSPKAPPQAPPKNPPKNPPKKPPKSLPKTPRKHPSKAPRLVQLNPRKLIGPTEANQRFCPSVRYPAKRRSRSGASRRTERKIAPLRPALRMAAQSAPQNPSQLLARQCPWNPPRPRPWKAPQKLPLAALCQTPPKDHLQQLPQM